MTGIILAGGKSSRFGGDKALVRIAGQPLIQHVVNALSQVFSNIIIVANDVEKYRQFGEKVVRDLVPGQGPLSGIHAGLSRSSDLYNFIVACDMPFLKPELIRLMKDRVSSYDALMPRHEGKVEPLHAFYSKNCLEQVELQLKSQSLKITDLISQVNTGYIETEDILAIDPLKLSFVNINSRQDYARIKMNERAGVAS